MTTSPMDICRSAVEGVIDRGTSEEGGAEEDVSVLVADMLNLKENYGRKKQQRDIITHERVEEAIAGTFVK